MELKRPTVGGRPAAGAGGTQVFSGVAPDGREPSVPLAAMHSAASSGLSAIGYRLSAMR
ncbi:MAG: hypothetical protein WCK70_04965 [Chloroflexales bacterium]